MACCFLAKAYCFLAKACCFLAKACWFLAKACCFLTKACWFLAKAYWFLAKACCFLAKAYWFLANSTKSLLLNMFYFVCTMFNMCLKSLNEPTYIPTHNLKWWVEKQQTNYFYASGCLNLPSSLSNPFSVTIVLYAYCGIENKGLV